MQKWRGVQGGTPSGERLCDNCTSSTIIKCDNGVEKIFCHSMPEGSGSHQIKDIVVECSSFRKRGELSIHAMEEMGWILETKKGQIIGFVNPIEFKKKNPDSPIVPNKYGS